MPQIIKQISVYDGQSWQTRDIGSTANNVSYSSEGDFGTVLGLETVEGSLKSIFPTLAYPVENRNSVLILDSTGLISPTSISSTELGHLSGVESSIQEQINNIQLGAYPIGSVYCSIDSTIDPAQEFGGSWEIIQNTNLPFVAWQRVSQGGGD